MFLTTPLSEKQKFRYVILDGPTAVDYLPISCGYLANETYFIKSLHELAFKTVRVNLQIKYYIAIKLHSICIQHSLPFPILVVGLFTLELMFR